MHQEMRFSNIVKISTPMGKSEDFMSQNKKYIPEKHKHVVCRFPFVSSWPSVIDIARKQLYVKR